MKKYRIFADIDSFVIIGIVAPIFGLIVNKSLTNVNLTFMVAYVLYLYILSVFLIRYFTFEEEYYEVTFPMRILFHNKKVYYSEIEYAIYVIGGFGGSQLKIKRNDKKGYANFIPLTSKKAKPLMKFLKSKGIKIKIYSDYSIEEYNEFLDPEDREKKVKYYR